MRSLPSTKGARLPQSPKVSGKSPKIVDFWHCTSEVQLESRTAGRPVRRRDPPPTSGQRRSAGRCRLHVPVRQVTNGEGEKCCPCISNAGMAAMRNPLSQDKQQSACWPKGVQKKKNKNKKKKHTVASRKPWRNGRRVECPVLSATAGAALPSTTQRYRSVDDGPRRPSPWRSRRRRRSQD